ncbi:MAG TPA: F0F1 ATP synthase subunit B [Verrucomicrobiae bacterium]|nr:F0F1 ATP synthase subunit B [Verrucomicrobiae bacterium]
MPVILSTNILIPNLTLVVEVVVFLGVLWILARYVYPPLDQAIQARQHKIAQSIHDAEQLKAAVEEGREQAQQALREARRQAQAILDQAQKLGEGLREELRTKGRQDQEAMLTRARAELEQERRRAVDDLRRQVADLSVAAASRILGRELDPATHQRLVADALSEVDLRA